MESEATTIAGRSVARSSTQPRWLLPALLSHFRAVTAQTKLLQWRVRAGGLSAFRLPRGAFQLHRLRPCSHQPTTYSQCEVTCWKPFGHTRAVPGAELFDFLRWFNRSGVVQHVFRLHLFLCWFLHKVLPIPRSPRTRNSFVNLLSHCAKRFPVALRVWIVRRIEPTHLPHCKCNLQGLLW